MGREFRPGDVAMVTFRDIENEEDTRPRILVVRRPGELLQWWGPSGYVDADDSTVTARPLVVIDPEDNEQVERLATLIAHIRWDEDTADRADVQAITRALREFADPKPPKPEEPTGDGAVVEDCNGHRWVRIASQNESPDSPPWRHRGHTARWWDSVNAVRVLSEGVSA